MPQVDLVGLFGSRFAMGCWAALALPFVFSVHPACCLILLPLFFYSKASTAVLAGVLCFQALMWFRNKKLFWIGSALIGAGACWYVFNDSHSGQFMKRIQIWWVSLTLLKSEMWFGMGLGQWKEAMVMTQQETSAELKYWSFLHNDILQFVWEVGVVGAIGLYLFFKGALKSIFSRMQNVYAQMALTSMIPLLVVSFFHFPFHIGRLAGISIYIMAVFLACLEHIKFVYQRANSFEEKKCEKSYSLA
jgi:hypothetical protein